MTLINIRDPKFIDELRASAVEAVADVVHDMHANSLRPDTGEYDEKREARIREQMEQYFHYAESGPTFDPEGKYLCGSCYYRQLMDWGDTDACYIVEGKTKMDIGSCCYYRNGNPDSEWNPLPILKKYSQVESMYAERPKAKAFGCSRCEYGDKAKKPDSTGRKSWCKFFGVHIRKDACCTMEDGPDMQTPGEIKAGGPGSGCNPDVGECGPHPKGVMHEQVAPQKGSNPGGVFRGEDGVLRYVKLYSKPQQAAGELVANAVYTSLGLNAPKTQMFDHEGKFGIATDIVEGKPLNQITLNKNAANEILKGFAADVLTANWDAVGLEHDNIIVKGIDVTRIDQGGAFLSRAKGGDKPLEGILGISEVDKLLNPSINPAYAKVAQAAGVKSWKDIPDFKQQVEKITDFGNKYPGGWKGYANVILDSMGGKDISQDIRNKIGGILQERAKALNELINKKEEPVTPVGKTPKGDAAFKKLTASTVKEFATTYGAAKLGMSQQDYANSYNRTGGGGYKYGKSEETPREKLFKSLGFELTQLDKLHSNMREWTSHANDTTRNAAKEVLAGKPKSEMGKLWYVENQITQSILGPGKIKLYRGVKGSQADQLATAAKSPEGPKTLFKILLSSANSWSDDPKIAKSFGSGKVYLRKNMPTKFVMTSYKTNHIFATAHPDEKEFLCMTPEKGVAMKRKNLLLAAKQKVAIIDLRKGVNDAWLHNMRKKKIKAGGLGSGCHGPNCGRKPLGGIHEKLENLAAKHIAKGVRPGKMGIHDVRPDITEVYTDKGFRTKYDLYDPRDNQVYSETERKSKTAAYEVTKMAMEDLAKHGFSTDKFIKALDYYHIRVDAWNHGEGVYYKSAQNTTNGGDLKKPYHAILAVEAAVTRAYLRSKFGDTLTLYRGVSGKYAQAIADKVGKKDMLTIKTRPADSWTLDPKVARAFATKLNQLTRNPKFSSASPVVLKAHIPTDFAVSATRTGLKIGRDWQDEVVIAPPDKKINVMSSDIQVIKRDKGIKSASETSQKGQFAGSLWNGIQIAGFTGPEEEDLKAMLSRIPPELFFNVKLITSNKELDIKHGRFIPETKTVQYNPRNFKFRQRFGKGPGWVQHAEMTAVHEVGHSLYEAMTTEKQKEWEDCSGWVKGFKEGNVPPYVEVRPGWPHETSQWTHAPGTSFTRHYAEKNPNEDFADSFAFYILEKGHQMEPSKRQFLDSLIRDNVKKYPQASIQSPAFPYPKQEAESNAGTV